MAFVMIATGATSRSRVRTWSMRPLVASTALAALALLGSGAAIGYWLAQVAPMRVHPPIAAERDAAPSPFTIERLGEISGRLFRLESEAAQLGRRIGKFDDEPKTPGSKTRATALAPKSPAAAPSLVAPGASDGASGGPWLPPRVDAADPEAFDQKLARVERHIDSVAEAATRRTLEQMRMPTRLPIEGAALTSTFGNRVDPFVHTLAFHAGLDFAAVIGTSIDAAAGGTVVFAGLRSGFGEVVEIDHGNGLMTRYAHASRLLVKAGDIVTPGQSIAIVGSTGRSTGPHLHFEVLRNGEPVDPKRYLARL